MKRKSLILLSTMAATLAPVVSLISCGNNPAPAVHHDYQLFEVENNSADISAGVVETIKEHLHNYINEFTEGQALKPIKIFDSTNWPFRTDADAQYDEGDYLPQSDEIIINTRKLPKYYSNFTEDDRANYIMQLIAHEYNHYVDHSYLLNIDSKSPFADDSIYGENKGWKVQAWPKAFVDQFKEDLHYDVDTPKYSSEDIAPGIKSIGSKYNAKDIFDYANGPKDPFANTIDVSGLAFAPSDPAPEEDLTRTLYPDSIAYIYSMDELFARKMQIITSKYFRSTHFNERGYITRADTKLDAAPYLQDVVNYQRGLNDFDNDGQYLADKPTEELNTLYETSRGALSSPISFAEVKNEEFVKDDGSLGGTIDRSKIRFGGVVTSKNKFLGYMEGDKFVNIPITIKDRSGAAFGPSSQFDYLTTYLDVANIKGKRLYFADSATGSNKTKITTTRDIKFGKVSTRRMLDKDTDTNYAFDENAILQSLLQSL